MSQALTLSVLRLQEAWGLCAHGPQVVNLFHLLGGFDICKELGKCASHTVIQVLQRGGNSRRGLSREGPIGSCSVTH